MATFSHTFTLDDGTTVSKTATIPAPQDAYLIAWGMATFPQQFDDNGNPLSRTPTNILEQWIAGTIAETLAKVNSYIVEQATEQVAASVQPITVSIS